MKGNYIYDKLQNKNLQYMWNELKEFIKELSNGLDVISEDLYQIKDKIQNLESYNIFDKIAKDYYENNFTQYEIMKKYEISYDELRLIKDKFNIKYGNKKTRKGCPVLQFDAQGNFMGEYSSVKEAGLKTFTSYKNIYAHLNGKSRMAGGFVWKYKEKINESVCRKQRQNDCISMGL